VLFVRKTIRMLECVNRFLFFFWGRWEVSFGGVVCVRRDRESVVMEDVVDNVFFTLVFFCVEVVGV